MAIDATKKTGKKTSHVVYFIVSMALKSYTALFTVKKCGIGLFEGCILSAFIP